MAKKWSSETQKNKSVKNWSAELAKRTKYRETDTSMVNQAYIDSLMKDASNYFKTADADYGKVNWGNAASSYEARSTAWNDLSKRADTVSAWLYHNRNSLNDDAYNYYNNYLDSIYEGGRGIVDSFKNYSDYFGDWSSQEEYDKWYSDYQETQRMANSKEGKAGWQKYLSDQSTPKESIPWWQKAILRGYATSNDNPVVAAFNNAVYDYQRDESYRTPSDNWTDKERNVFGYYYATNPAKAFTYAADLNNQKNLEQEQKKMAEIVQNATSSFGSGAVNSLGALFAATTGLADTLNYLAMQAANRPITEDGFVSPFEYSQAVQSGISSKLNEMSGTLNVGGMDIGLGNLYGIGMSIASSQLSGRAFGAVGTLVNFFGQGAAQGVKEAKQMGATDEQALLYGSLSGAFEGIAEMIGFDHLTSGLTSASTMKAALKNIIAQAGAEGLEEGWTSLANSAIDIWVLQDKGKILGKVNELMANGVSETDAKKQVLNETFGEALYDTITGAISGAVGGGIETGIKNHNINTQFKNEYIKDPDSLKSLLEGIALENPSVDTSKLMEKYRKGEKISANELRKFVYANEQSVWNQDKSKLVDSTEKRLSELGEKGDLRKLAESIVNAQYGYSFDDAILDSEQAILNNEGMSVKDLSYLMAEYSQNAQNKAKLSKADQKAIRNSEYGSRVSNELNPNMREETSSAWAQGVKTNRLGNTAENVAKTRVALAQLNEVSKSQKKLSSDPISYKSGVVDASLTPKGRDAKIEGENKTVSETYARAEGYKGLANETFSKYYKGENIEEYALGFREAYDYGLNGTVKDVKDLANHGSFKSYINEEAREMAFNAGVVDAKYMGIKSKTIKVDGDYKVTVPMSNKALSESKQATIELMKVLAPIAKVNMSTMVSLKDHGLYDPKTNTIYIDLAMDGRDVMIFTLAHELTHHLKRVNPEQFDEFARALFEEVGKTENVEERIAKWMRENKKYYPNMDQTKFKALAREEVVAEMCESFLTDEKVVQRISQKVYESDKGLWNTIKKWFEDLVARLKKLFADLDPQSENGRIVREMGDRLDAVRQMWADMVVEAGTIVEQDLANKDVSHSRKYYEEHLSDLDKKYDSDEAMVSLETLKKRYEKVVEIWDRLGGELNSQFLEEWNNKSGKDRSFTVFKAQAGYKYNIELSSMCKKGVPLFEAIDTIVKKEVMKELNVKVIGKAEKQILYDLLQKHNFDIPCQICYVEQARQREGGIIDAFLNGKVETNKKGETTKVKLGWNQILDMVEKEMKNLGVSYKFASVDRSIGSDSYTPAEVVMDEKTQKAYYEALKKVANDEITRYNKAERKARQLIKDTTPSAINATLGGTLPSNLKIFKTLFMESNSRLKIESDLLYSSMTTKNLATFHHELYTAFNMQGGVSGYKTKQGTVVYWGDILKKTWEQDTIRKAGGIRNQSNSDFQMYTFLDQVQMYIDFSAKGYYLQAYTKVLAELKLFGKSGAKINASLIPRVKVYQNADGSVDIERTRANAGLDENGNLIFDDIEGINHKEAFMLIADPEYSKSIGGICIGYSDNHIAKMLDDDRIQLIIGYHDKTNDPNARYRGARYAKNYNGLNEAQNGTKTVHIGFNKFVGQAEKKFGYDVATETFAKESITYKGETYVVDDIPRLAATLYLEECQRKGYAPAYSKCDIDFSKHPNYYKLLADFSLYNSEGHYCPHKKVQFNMPSTVPYLDANGNKSTMSSEAYIKKELEAEMKVRDSISEALADESADGLIPSFVREVNKLHSVENNQKNYLSAQKNPDIIDMAERVEKGNFYDGEKVNLGIVPNDIATYIQSLTGVDVRGFKVAIEAKQMKHILARHGKLGKADHSMSDYNNIAKIQYVIENPDDIEKLGKAKGYKQTINGKTVLADTVLYEKSIGEKSYYVVQAVPDTNAKTLYIVSAYIGKQSNKKEAPQFINAKSPNETSKNETVYASNDSISQNDDLSIENDEILDEVKSSRKTVDPITSREELAKALSKVAKGEDRAIVESYKANVNLIKGETERLESLRKEIDDIKYKKSITYEGRELSVKEFEQIAYTRAEEIGIEAERVKFKALKESGKYIATVDGKKILEAEKRFRTKDDIDKLATLEHNYQATIKRITTYDKKLLQIEAMSSIKQLINREKKASYDKAKAEGKEALKEYKAQAIAEQKKITERYQEMRKKNVEGRKTTEMRHKLMNTVHTLDQLLVNPTKKKHIPIGLQKPVAEALNILNTDTVGAEERLAKITAELKTTDDPVEIERLLERYNRIKAQGDKIKEKIDSLKAAYDKLLTSDDEIIRNSHDEVISNMIQNASEKIGDKAVRDMTYEELEMLYNMYRAILKTVRDANTSFKMAKGEEISTLGQSVMGELAGFERKNKEQIKLIADIKDGAEWYQWNNLKPIYAFKRIGSSTLEALYNNVREGEDVWAVDMSEARAFSDAEKTKFGYSKWDMDKSYTFRTRSGKDFKLTLGQIMSIYAYTKRGEQAINHLVEGGFVYDGTTEIKKNVKGNVELTYELKDSTAYRLSEEIIGQINATLTPAQKSFVDSMQNYLSTVMGEKGNEVSLALYDIKLFGEKNYFPLKSSQVFLERAREQARGEVKVKNKGFTKETTPKANNPIVLESFMDVWANHCVEMGMYHAFTLPLEDFYRVYNYKERATDEKDSESVIMHLENAFGNSATKYIDQLLVDINGGTRADPRINFSSRWIAKFKKAKTFLSASVVIQQPSAVTRAMALIDGKYFIEKPTNHKATWNEIKKYAPVAIIKEMGYFDTGMGLSSKDWLKNEPTKMEKMEEALSKAPAYADEIGWNIIWRAVKREIAATTNLKVNSEEFLQRCGERFTEVITMTQVYDSVFARSSLMRSKDGLAKMLTAFMAEPTTTINMLTYGLNQRVRGYKGVMSHFVGACLTSAILNSMLVSIVYAARDDDEDEEYWEKYFGALGKQTIDSVNVFKMMPFIKDMVSILEGFTVSRTDVSLITDIYWAWQKLDNDNVSAYKKVEDFAGSIAAIFGVPLKNLMRDLRALWNLITSSMK